ncbi:hypothetical protein BC833DRAFT_571671 [Globomyces pollinis-pini]|nr:hypothetical protein BC833DRAFT_571671 [Globomyces pollinis-pini]
MSINKNWLHEKEIHHKYVESKEIITSFTDSQTLHGWKPEDSLREIWQNFKDGLKNTFHEKVKLEIVDKMGDSCGIEGYVNDQKVGSVDLRNKDKISIRQKFCLLNESHLQLASSKGNGENTIGGHGEGFKVGINLLLRKGFKVTYQMPYCEWQFSLKHKYSKKFKNMCVQIVKTNVDSDWLKIIIEGHEVRNLFHFDMDIDFSDGLKFQVGNLNGQIYLATKNAFRGSVYSRGLLIDKDKDLKTLGLAVDLNFLISRDRHLIPHDLWDTIAKILKSGVEKVDLNENNVFEIILQNSADFDSSMIKPSVREVLRLYISRKLHCLPDNVIFIQDEDSNIKMKKLLAIGKQPYVHKALTDIVPFESMFRNFILDQNHYVAKDAEAIGYANALTNYCQSFSKTLEMKIELDIKNLPAEIASMCPIVQKYYTGFGVEKVEYLVIAVDKSQLNVNQLFYLANQIQMGILNWNTKIDGFKSVSSEIFEDFISDKLNYQSKKYDSGSIKPTTNTDSGYSSRVNSPAPTLSEHSSPKVSIKDRVKVDNRIMNNNLKNEVAPNRLDIPAESGQTGRSGNCEIHIGELLMKDIDQNILFSREIWETYLDDVDLQMQIKQSLPLLNRIIENSRRMIANKLHMTSHSQLSITPVLIREDILGFTNGGIIYLNLLPLRVAKEQPLDVEDSIFMTICHELTHRAHRVHDSAFAQENSKLIYNIMK